MFVIGHPYNTAMLLAGAVAAAAANEQYNKWCSEKAKEGGAHTQKQSQNGAKNENQIHRQYNIRV